MKNTLLILGFILCLYFSCASLQKTNDENQSEVINLLLEKAAKNRDSVYVIDWVIKKGTTKSKSLYDYKSAKILTIKEDYKTFSDFKRFLSKEGIDYDKELTYFTKQLKNLTPINKEKIKIGNVRFFPAGTDADKLNFYKDYKFTGYYYDLPRIVFTKDGNNAIVYQKNKGIPNHFTLFKRIDGKWKGTFEYLDAIPAME